MQPSVEELNKDKHNRIIDYQGCALEGKQATGTKRYVTLQPTYEQLEEYHSELRLKAKPKKKAVK